MKLIAKTCVLCLSLAGFCLSTSARADSLFTFDTGVAPGTDTPFTLTNNGVTAQFDSITGAFTVSGNFGFAAPFSGNLLFDNLQGNNIGIPLIISFNTLVSGISLDFGTDDFGIPTALQLVAFNGGNVVGTSSASGNYINAFPQGVLDFSGATFDTIELFDNNAPAFAIDNVDVSGAAPATFGVPEINVAGLGSLAVVLLGTLALMEEYRSAIRRA